MTHSASRDAKWQNFFDYLRKALGAGFARVLLTIALLVLNPFNIQEWSDQRSHDVWQRLYAPFYPLNIEPLRLASPPVVVPADHSGLNHIGVLLIREDRLGGSRRPTINDVIDILADMRLGDAGYAQPLAVFFDQSLDLQLAVDSTALLPKADTPACTGASTDRDARSACLVARVAAATAYTGPNGWAGDSNCQVSPIAKLQCIRKAGGVPVIFADPRPLPEMAPQSVPESALLAALGEVAMLSPVVLSEHSYALVGPQALVQRTNVAGWQLSPAALLYLVYCYQDPVTGNAAKAAPDAAKPDHRNCPDALTSGYQKATAKANHWPQTLEAPLEITSGVHPESRFDASIVHVQAGTRASNCWIADAQHRNLWKIMSSQLAPALFADAQRPCTYPDELDATVLASKAMALYPDARDTFFRNRLILVGESFEVSPDRPELEPFGRVPGVFVHAMATDNLIERGESYPHGLDPVGSTALSLLAVFVVTTVTALFVAIAKDLRVWSARLLIGSLWAALTVGLLLALTRFTPPLRVEGFNYVFVFVFIFAGFVEVVSAILIIPLLKDFLRFMVGDKRKTVQVA